MEKKKAWADSEDHIFVSLGNVEHGMSVDEAKNLARDIYRATAKTLKENGSRICMDGGDNEYWCRCLDCGCTAPFDVWQSRFIPPIWKDQKLKSISFLVDHIFRENERQIQKWGVQERSPFEWETYLSEEVGEVAEAISEFVYRNGTREDIFKESIQVATLALKIAEMSQGGGK